MIGLRPQELIFLMVGLAFWVLPIAAAIWIIRTLHRIERAQDQLQASLDALSRKSGLGA